MNGCHGLRGQGSIVSISEIVVTTGLPGDHVCFYQTSTVLSLSAELPCNTKAAHTAVRLQTPAGPLWQQDAVIRPHMEQLVSEN